MSITGSTSPQHQHDAKSKPASPHWTTLRIQAAKDESQAELEEVKNEHQAEFEDASETWTEGDAELVVVVEPSPSEASTELPKEEHPMSSKAQQTANTPEPFKKRFESLFALVGASHVSLAVTASIVVAITIGVAHDIFTNPSRRVACRAAEVGLSEYKPKNSGYYRNVTIRFEVPDVPGNLCLWFGGSVHGESIYSTPSTSSSDLFDQYIEENFNDAEALFHQERDCYLHPNFPKAAMCDLGRGLAQIGGYERAFSGILILWACTVIGHPCLSWAGSAAHGVSSVASINCRCDFRSP